MKTTLRIIKSFSPCGQREGSGVGWDKLTKALGSCDLDKEVTILQILNSNGIQDAIWCLRAVGIEHYRLFLANVAESVLHIFEEKHPTDFNPRKAIDGIRLFHKGKLSRSELETLAFNAYASASAVCSSAVYASSDAAFVSVSDADADAINDVVYAAADAVDAIIHAADDVADDVTDVAVYASSVDAVINASYASASAIYASASNTDAAGAAATYTTDAAVYAADDVTDARKQKWSEIERLLRSYLWVQGY